MLQSLLDKIIAGSHLTQPEAAALIDALLAEDVSEARIAAALVALAAKGETEEELAGFAEIMRSRCARIATRHKRFIDTCGTGGSKAKTFNVSTAAAFVVAAAGVPVAKHGNIGVTSRAGSADVLRALGVKIDQEPLRVGEIFDEIGICFMFAPAHHAAMKRVSLVRRDLGVRTIFNLLGPLTNPAGAPFQVIGVSHEAACEKVALALSRLGTRRAWIVRGADGLDEITIFDKTVVHEVSQQGVKRFEVSPEEFGLRHSPPDGLRSGSAEDNARLISEVLAGVRRDAARDLILINAAASLLVAGEDGATFSESIRLAGEVLDSGAALHKLESLRRLSNI